MHMLKQIAKTEILCLIIANYQFVEALGMAHLIWNKYYLRTTHVNLCTKSGNSSFFNSGDLRVHTDTEMELAKSTRPTIQFQLFSFLIDFNVLNEFFHSFQMSVWPRLQPWSTAELTYSIYTNIKINQHALIAVSSRERVCERESMLLTPGARWNFWKIVKPKTEQKPKAAKGHHHNIKN